MPSIKTTSSSIYYFVLACSICIIGLTSAQDRLESPSISEIFEGALSRKMASSRLDLSDSIKNDFVEFREFRTDGNIPVIRARVLYEAWQGRKDPFIADLKIVSLSDIPKILAISSVTDMIRLSQNDMEIELVRSSVKNSRDLGATVHQGWVALSPNGKLVVVLQAFYFIGEPSSTSGARLQSVRSFINEIPLP